MTTRTWYATLIGLSALALAVTLRAQSPGGVSPAVAAAPAPHSGTALFVHSDNCQSCHNNLTTAAGQDVSIGTAWRSTIMANAARDPYFHASTRRETLDHPAKAAEIQDECAACHLPIAQKTAQAAGGLAAFLDHPESDALARDGVSCTVCHQIANDGLGTLASFNGRFVLRPSRADGIRDIFGPFAVDAGRRTIMRSVTGYEQVAAPHVRQSELCASCHTLITDALGPDGRVVGSLPEQMNFQEWRHSAYYGEGRSCQSCHMPRVNGPIRVASVLGAERDGLSQHGFVGGNAFMLRLMNRFRLALGVEAASSELEATARLTEQQLRTDTAAIAVSPPSFADGALSFAVDVQNLTGHKFPTGYPSRRTWLHVTVRDPSGAVLFESGQIGGSGAIQGNDNDVDAARYEPHYDSITQPDQVQIYETILGDTGGRVTTGLLSAVRYLKDNRLLPRGFDKATADPQIGVYGEAVHDVSFAASGDRVHYRISVPQAAASCQVEVELRYQPIGYRWAHNLAQYDAPEPRAFTGYYTATAGGSSSLVRTATVTATR